MRVAVVGHVEWIELARVERIPAAGEIVHAKEAWEEPGGGGAVAAVQLAKLANGARLYTALGDDELGHRAHDELSALGVEVEATFRPEAQRRGFVHLDGTGERTITVIGERVGPRREDQLPWQELSAFDAVYFTAGDAGAATAARAARTMVATARAIGALAQARVELDALVASAHDENERYETGDLDPAPRLVLLTRGAAGGDWRGAGGKHGHWEATPLPGPVADFYGCGDSFAAGVTYGLGQEMDMDTAATLGARCGAACVTGHGPYRGQLTAADPS